MRFGERGCDHDAGPVMNSTPAPRRINHLPVRLSSIACTRDMNNAVGSSPVSYSQTLRRTQLPLHKIHPRVRGTGYFCPKQKGR